MWSGPAVIAGKRFITEFRGNAGAYVSRGRSSLGLLGRRWAGRAEYAPRVMAWAGTCLAKANSTPSPFPPTSLPYWGCASPCHCARSTLDMKVARPGVGVLRYAPTVFCLRVM